MSSDQRFHQAALELGFSFDGEIRIGGNYLPLTRHGNEIHVSGQIPRIDDKIIVTGRAGDGTTLADAQLAARICAMRAMALLQRHLGSLEQIGGLLKVNVYIQSSNDFIQQSEVADAASEILLTVLGPAGTHARTSLGVFQLPKNATVELDLVAFTH